MSHEFPALPDRHPRIDWPADTIAAHRYLADVFRRGKTLLGLNNPDPVRTQIVVGDIFGKCFQLMEALESEYPQAAWVTSAAEALFAMGGNLQQAANVSEGVERGHVQTLTAVREVRVIGKRGRPRKTFDMAILREALRPNRKVTVARLARAMKVHPNTLRNFLKREGMMPRFSTISEQELDTVLLEFRRQYPRSGARYATGFLSRHRIRVQRNRIRGSLKRVNPVTQHMLRNATIARRDYDVARPGSLLHMDGHHKLILWGFVIHGIYADGDNPCLVQILGLRASSNNKASTVLRLFLDVVDKYGWPSRVRGDRGSENVEVSVCMTLARGLNRASFIWGTSTHNTRIERLWVEVGTQFARAWRAFFTRLERLHRLNRNQHGHIWLLHRLFLLEINEDCEAFTLNWNNHPISRRGNEHTPEEHLYLLGKLENGEFAQPSNMHPSIQAHYGHDANLDERIRSDIARNVHHDAVSAPDIGCPFPSSEAEQAFETSWRHIEATAASPIPSGFLLRQDELAGSVYPTAETIRVARKDTDIPLPFEIWYPRAVRWAQGLTVMTLVIDTYT
ncbi:hypothetical protein NMY22_g17726 [Coprinellus aureogranulatus]|nr:hypothetical protein NMY22_g17726 [Coprinellus aureogranulatus]